MVASKLLNHYGILDFFNNSDILIYEQFRLPHHALHGALVEQIQYAFSNELVSTDIVGNPCPSVFDSNATILSPDKKSVVLYVWYDNEYGYTRQVIRFSKHISEVRRAIYY